MPLTVRGQSALTGVRPGDRVKFRLVIDKGTTHIDRLRLLSAAPADQGLVMTPAASTLVPIGAAVPDFALTDQRGASVRLSDLRGRVVVVTFIYTRCPLPDYCPRMTNLAACDRFRARSWVTYAFTVAFDPGRHAGAARRAPRDCTTPTSGWHFLTGMRRGSSRCARRSAWVARLRAHHARAADAVIDREGRLAAAVEGKDFTGQTDR